MSAIRLASIALIGLASCGDAPVPIAPLGAEQRAMIGAALESALEDSVALAGATFDVPVRLETAIAEDGDSVRVVDRFRLTKRPGGEFAAIDRRHSVSGERALLKNMYSFENSKGELREESEARFAGIGFGADHREILRDLLAGRLGLDGPLLDSADADGRALRVIRFHGEDVAGRLEIDRISNHARRVEMQRESSSIIGGYRFAMRLELRGPDERLRLPVRMTTSFEYDRLTSSGSGTVSMIADTSALAPGAPDRATGTSHDTNNVEGR